MNAYYSRIVDEELKFKLNTFGAVHITGPKWCGKTRTAEQFAKSSIYLQSMTENEAKLASLINPETLIKGERPRLIDEWQDAPHIWDIVRFECDHSDRRGNFILTGSTSKKVETSHTGTGRISELRMYPMSLFESKESNGKASLGKLFDNNPMEKEWISDLSVPDLIFAACRGGWPQSITTEEDKSKLAIAKDYYKQIFMTDMFSVDKVKRRPEIMESVLHSYARNISTMAKNKTIFDDVRQNEDVTDKTLSDYVNVLRDLFVIQDVHGWCPALRSSAGMRSGPKREFVDPSIAVAALKTSPEKLNLDLKTFGFIFECLCIRDLRIYSNSMGGELSYYHDRYGLEADAVLHLDDGRYALFECKLGSDDVLLGAQHLVDIEDLIKKHNKEHPQNKRDLPTFKAVITAGKYGGHTPDGVYIIPIGCLGP